MSSSLGALPIDEVVISGAVGPLAGEFRPPGDKSISHRAVLLAGLAEGVSRLDGLSDGEDVTATLQAMAAMGAEVSVVGPPVAAGRRESLAIAGGDSRLHEPDDVISAGNSGTTTRLLAGVVAARPWVTVITGDRSLRSRPMARVADPLRAMGAQVLGRHLGTGGGSDIAAPLVVAGGHLSGVTYSLPVPSAQVKSAVLLAGLRADGPTTVIEPTETRAHTEEMLADLAKAPVEVHPIDHVGRAITVRPGPVTPFSCEIPADPSQAAFIMVAAALIPGSEIAALGTYLGPGRDGIVTVLMRMGVDITSSHGVGLGGGADLTVRYCDALTATTVGGSELPSLVDEVPVLAVAMALSSGQSRICQVGELRAKESDRVQGTIDLLAAFGARAWTEGDDLIVAGSGHLSPGRFESRGDHRLAMAAVVAALVAGGTSRVGGFSAVATSYPGFLADVDKLAPGRIVEVR
jgi:3-phosphoshikimate 1-carboxyvinyltransferase